jgi:hypothetical protein
MSMRERREAYAQGMEEAALLVERFCSFEELRGCASRKKSIRDMAARGLVVAKAVREGAAAQIRAAANVVRDDPVEMPKRKDAKP